MMQERFKLQGPQEIRAAASSAAQILTLMIMKGLARIGFENTLQGTPRMARSSDGKSWIDADYWLSGEENVFTVDPSQSQDWVKPTIKSTIQGYAYNTETVPLGLLLLH